MTEFPRSRAYSLLSRMPSLKPWTEDDIELYGVALDSIPPLLVPEVVYRAVTTLSYRPSVRELFSLASDMLAGPHPDPAQAWQQVERLLVTRGIYCQPDPIHENVYREGRPEFSHKFIEQAVDRMGGWRSICLSDLDMNSLRAHFQRAYDDVLEAARRENCEALASSQVGSERLNSAQLMPMQPQLRVVTSG